MLHPLRIPERKNDAAMEILSSVMAQQMSLLVAVSGVAESAGRQSLVPASFVIDEVLKFDQSKS